LIFKNSGGEQSLPHKHRRIAMDHMTFETALANMIAFSLPIWLVAEEILRCSTTCGGAKRMRMRGVLARGRATGVGSLFTTQSLSHLHRRLP
jgi:hypothetical protein